MAYTSSKNFIREYMDTSLKKLIPYVAGLKRLDYINDTNAPCYNILLGDTKNAYNENETLTISNMSQKELNFEFRVLINNKTADVTNFLTQSEIYQDIIDLLFNELNSNVENETLNQYTIQLATVNKAKIVIRNIIVDTITTNYLTGDISLYDFIYLGKIKYDYYLL